MQFISANLLIFKVILKPSVSSLQSFRAQTTLKNFLVPRKNVGSLEEKNYFASKSIKNLHYQVDPNKE
jgi:hypothetical protein